MLKVECTFHCIYQVRHARSPATFSAPCTSKQPENTTMVPGSYHSLRRWHGNTTSNPLYHPTVSNWSNHSVCSNLPPCISSAVFLTCRTRWGWLSADRPLCLINVKFRIQYIHTHHWNRTVWCKMNLTRGRTCSTSYGSVMEAVGPTYLFHPWLRGLHRSTYVM